MPLIAIDSTTGLYVTASELAVGDPLCPIPECRSDMGYVRETTGEHPRVRHFRHNSQTRRCRPWRANDHDRMTEWHSEWQLLTADRSRIEVTRANGRTSARADILTRYDWAVEVQHSPLTRATVSRRESAWDGKVMWLIDGCSGGNAPVAEAVPVSGRDLRVTLGAAGLFVRSIETSSAIHAAADLVYMLPAGNLSRFVRGLGLTIPMSHVRPMTRAEFAADVINAPDLPALPDMHAWKALWDADQATAAEATTTPPAAVPAPAQGSLIPPGTPECNYHPTIAGRPVTPAGGIPWVVHSPGTQTAAQPPQTVAQRIPVNPVHACAGKCCRTVGCAASEMPPEPPPPICWRCDHRHHGGCTHPEVTR